MAVSPGTRLGAYEILAALGAGGVGEVPGPERNLIYAIIEITKRTENVT